MRNKSWWFRLRCQLAQWLLGKDWQLLYRHLVTTGWKMGKNGAKLPWKEKEHQTVSVTIMRHHNP